MQGMGEEVFELADIDALAGRMLASLSANNQQATVITLKGDLGAGKTSLVQAMARHLGITETVISPTFVILKRYRTTHPLFTSLVHIDAYRIETVEELLPLHFKEILKESNTLVIIEWPERIAEALTEVPAQEYQLGHIDQERRFIKNYE